MSIRDHCAATYCHAFARHRMYNPNKQKRGKVTALPAPPQHRRVCLNYVGVRERDGGELQASARDANLAWTYF